MRWEDNAACAGMDPELFFPERGESTVEAKKVCAGCPVQVQCLQAGMGEDWGIWGGTSGRKRKRLRKRIRNNHPEAPLVWGAEISGTLGLGLGFLLAERMLDERT